MQCLNADGAPKYKNYNWIAEGKSAGAGLLFCYSVCFEQTACCFVGIAVYYMGAVCTVQGQLKQTAYSNSCVADYSGGICEGNICTTSRPQVALMILRSIFRSSFTLLEGGISRPHDIILELRTTLAVFVKVIFVQLVDRKLL